MRPIYLAIADDEILFRKGMDLLIDDFKDMELLFDASDGQVLLDWLSNTSILPDIILLDLKMPILNGIETANIVVKQYPDIKIIVLSTYFSEAFILNMIEVGAAAYFAKNTPPEEVEYTIRMVAEKGFHYSDEIMEIIRKDMMARKRQSNSPFEIQLTPREKSVLQLICTQYTNTEIADQLHISTRTVEWHRNSLLKKLNCKNTAGLVAFAIQQNLVKIDPTSFWS